MTSLEVAYDPTVPPSPSALAALTTADAEHDRRWEIWLAKGRDRDVRLRRRMGWFVSLSVISLVTGAVWALTR